MEIEQLLITKLYIPPTRPELISRPRLLERMNEGLHRKLTLISAPAGFGKTTLVAQWLHRLRSDSTEGNQTENRIAWLSLDGRDNDPALFLTYLITALNQAEEAKSPLGKIALGMLQSPQPQPTEAVLTSLINEIAAFPERIILVLDDYHLIETQTVHDSMSFLLENMPVHMHLVVATREDPLVPLSRLRARSQLSELRAADLRFTSSEAVEFLNKLMGLNLSSEDIHALETRTEGWIAGLQLAAISMRGRDDAASFIESFTGSHRLVLDYLIEEVLNQQADNIQAFLLQTAILDRLNASLCDALIEGNESQQFLEFLERTNLFIIPLDNERQWYRYHHLFADVLQTRLMVKQPDEVPVLRYRASKWFERKELWSDAINQAFGARDFTRVADLAELSWQTMDDSFQSSAWLGWAEQLPDELVRARPVLCTQYAWALWMDGQLEASEARLQDAERWLDPSGDTSEFSDGMIVVVEEQFKTLPAKIALARTYNAQAQGDITKAVKYAELALNLISEEDLMGRAQAAVSLGFIYWASGDLMEAHRALAGWMKSMQQAGNTLFVIASTFALADIMIGEGHLRDAVRAYKQSLKLTSDQDEHVQRVTAHLYLGLAMLHHEMGNQEACDRHLQNSRELGEQSTLPDWPNRWHLARAQLKESRGDLAAALDSLDEAQSLYVMTTLPDVRPIAALKARIYIRQGKLSKALAWVEERSLSVDDELSYLQEFEHITLSRVLISEYKSKRTKQSANQAIGLLERLLIEAEEKNRMGSVLEILVQKALAHQACGDESLALASLERALVLAKQEGYLRIFVDEGPPMARLLYTALSQDIAPGYVKRLLAAFPVGEPEQPASPSIQTSEFELIEPLSDRELEVLQLLAEGLTNPEIAARLYLSQHTIKVHARNIYAKLGVSNRTQAATRGKALGLIANK